MTQKGTHTWDLNLSYHRCPHCKKIFESRAGYVCEQGIYQRNLECTYCHHPYKEIKARNTAFNPFFGDPQPPEVEWR